MTEEDAPIIRNGIPESQKKALIKMLEDELDKFGGIKRLNILNDHKNRLWNTNGFITYRIIDQAIFNNMMEFYVIPDYSRLIGMDFPIKKMLGFIPVLKLDEVKIEIFTIIEKSTNISKKVHKGGLTEYTIFTGSSFQNPRIQGTLEGQKSDTLDTEAIKRDHEIKIKEISLDYVKSAEENIQDLRNMQSRNIEASMKAMAKQQSEANKILEAPHPEVNKDKDAKKQN